MKYIYLDTLKTWMEKNPEFSPPPWIKVLLSKNYRQCNHVWINSLLYKLNNCHFPKQLIKILQHFLANGFFKVKVAIFLSAQQLNKAGVQHTSLFSCCSACILMIFPALTLVLILLCMPMTLTPDVLQTPDVPLTSL